MFHHLQGHKDIWFYEFDYRGQYSYGDVFAATDEDGPIPGFKWGTLRIYISFLYQRSLFYFSGVSHCDELLYLFKTPTLFNGLKHHNDIIMIEKMVQLWTNFAIYG